MNLRDLVYGLYARRVERRLDLSQGPKHIGVILDGNRRWAKAAGEHHGAGPPGRRGQDRRVARLVRGDRRRGGHPVAAVHRQPRPPGGGAGPAARHHRGRGAPTWPPTGRWQVHHVGTWTCCPTRTQRVLKEAEQATDGIGGILVNVAVGYGGRQEIADAVRSLLHEHAGRGTSIEDLAEILDVEHISEHLYTRGQPDPDLVIRTSRRAAAVRLHALAERALGVLLLRGLLARLPQGRLPAGAARLRGQAPPLRSVSQALAWTKRAVGGTACGVTRGLCRGVAGHPIGGERSVTGSMTVG